MLELKRIDVDFGRRDKSFPLNTYDLLKIFAIFSMVADHVNEYCGIHSVWLIALGRVAMPVFLFLVGFNGSNRIGWPLIISFICVVPLQWELRGTLLPLNILFPIGLSRCLFRLYERLKLWRTPYPELMVAIGAFCAGLTSLIWEYGTIALLWALFGRLRRDRHPLASAVGAVSALLLIAAYWPQFAGKHWLLTLVAASAWFVLAAVPIMHPLRNIVGGTVVKFVSRISLWIYVTHFILLILVQKPLRTLSTADPIPFMNRHQSLTNYEPLNARLGRLELHLLS